MEKYFTPDNIMLLARILGMAFAIPVHEVAHAWVSDKLGDHTARNMGRLTLNPIRHIDPMGLLSMMIIGVGWAKPVPVNPNYYKNRKAGMALTAAAGPVSNLLLAFVSMLVYKLLYYGCLMYLMGAGAAQWPLWMYVVVNIIYYFAIINVSLALFNLLPIPPLDGSRILGLVLPERLYFSIQKIERYIMIVFMALIFLLPRLTGFSPVGWLLNDAMGAVLDGIDWLTGFVDMIFERVLAAPASGISV